MAGGDEPEASVGAWGGAGPVLGRVRVDAAAGGSVCNRGRESSGGPKPGPGNARRKRRPEDIHDIGITGCQDGQTVVRRN